MDRRRRNRRQSYQPPINRSSNNSPIINGLYSLAMMGCLTALVYMMLEYHCDACNNSSLKSMNDTIQGIAEKFAKIQHNYQQMENVVNKISKEIPRAQGQLEVLEAFAKTLEPDQYGRNPKSHPCLPYVDVYLRDPKTQSFGQRKTFGSGDHKDKIMNVTKRVPKTLNLKKL